MENRQLFSYYINIVPLGLHIFLPLFIMGKSNNSAKCCGCSSSVGGHLHNLTQVRGLQNFV